MVKTTELMQACFKAKTRDEMYICRDLAVSIADRSPWAWKLYYSGETHECLSDSSIKALEKVMQRAKRVEKAKRAKRKLEFEGEEEASSKKKGKVVVGSSSKQTSVDRVRSRVEGVTSEENKGITMGKHKPIGVETTVEEVVTEKGKKRTNLYVGGECVAQLVNVKEEPEELVRVKEEPEYFSDEKSTSVEVISSSSSDSSLEDSSTEYVLLTQGTP